MKTLFVVSLAMVLSTGVVVADPSLDRAREREKAGDLQASASLLASWLSANPGAADSASVFADYIRVEQDFPLLLDRAAGFLKAGKGVPGAAAQFTSIARLFDLAGRVEQARDAYLAAHAEGAPDSTLVSAFLLSVRMNDTDSMTAVLQKLSGSSASARILLQALWDLHSGDRASARSALTGLSEQTGDPDLALKALWVLYESAQETGDTADQAAARARLGARFAASPESALAGAPNIPSAKVGRSIVVPSPAPGSLAPEPTAAAAVASPATAPGPAAPAATAPTPAAPTPAVPTPAVPAPASPDPAAVTPSPPAASPGSASAAAPASSSGTGAAVSSSPNTPAAPTYSVQAGSFGMKENADDLCAELAKLGLAPSQVRDVAQGKDRYRVFAGSGLDAAAAQQIVARLSAAGFYGFVVRDK